MANVLFRVSSVMPLDHQVILMWRSGDLRRRSGCRLEGQRRHEERALNILYSPCADGMLSRCSDVSSHALLPPSKAVAVCTVATVEPIVCRVARRASNHDRNRAKGHQHF